MVDVFEGIEDDGLDGRFRVTRHPGTDGGNGNDAGPVIGKAEFSSGDAAESDGCQPILV
jgi:hypothetical protein